MTSTKQSRLIGPHPDATNTFGVWMAIEDKSDGIHRALTEISGHDETIVTEWLANTLILHHYEDFRIEKLKEKYGKLGFTEYSERFRALPRADSTKKGNGAEAILLEYIEGTLRKALTKVYRFRYSTNIDQSLKGDDVLMVDTDDTNPKVYLGEAKFRKTPTSQVVREILGALGKSKMPISWNFLSNKLHREGSDAADRIDEIILQEIKDRGDLIYVGLLMSNLNASEYVEREIESADNPSLILISFGISEPETLIDTAFALAESKLSNPLSIGNP